MSESVIGTDEGREMRLDSADGWICSTGVAGRSVGLLLDWHCEGRKEAVRWPPS